MIKEAFNEFEADWAAMPQVDKAVLEKLKNKTIIISGQTLARCICYALLYQNETRNLSLKIIFLANEKNVIDDKRFDIFSRNDFKLMPYSSASQISQADYIVHTGMCAESSSSFPTRFAKEVNAAKAVCKAAKNTGASVVLLSDSRAYGNAADGRIYSENEYADIDNTSPATFDNQLLRTIEAYFHCEQKKSGFPLTVLRTGLVLGAHTGLRTFLDNVFEGVAKGERRTLVRSDRKYSFVYITDVFRAIIFSFTTLEQNQTYNVTGINSTVSTAAIAAILRDIYGKSADITLTDGKNESLCAINANKLSAYGCPAAVKLETAMELCVMSYMEDTRAMTLPHTHDGRLDAIQKIQLAYLLEVDRICKKHNIKYFLGGGTLLGAIRHKGFIPWDDDSDIMMLREDYDKFCKIAPKELPKELTFQSNKTDKHCYYEFAKIRVNNTVFASSFAKNHRLMHTGIALDVFCHDKTANSALGRKLHMAATIFTRSLVFNKWNHRKTENGGKIQNAVTNFCIQLFPLRFSRALMNKTISFFKNKRNAKYLYDGMGRNVYNGCFPIEYLDKVIYVDFEGSKLPVPENYDGYLKFLYGDYMELAPLSTRLGCHEILLCDIGKFDSLNNKA